MLMRDRRGVQPAIVVSTGNQALLDPADWIEVLSQDPRIRAIGLFIEGPGDVAALSLAARTASDAAYTGLVGLTLENEPALLECFRTVLRDNFDVAVLHADWTESGPEGTPTTRAWIQATREAGTPAAMASLMPENTSAQAQALCRAHGLACLQGLEDAMAAIAAAVRHGAAARDAAARDAMALPGPRPGAGPSRVLDEWQSKERLAQAGIPFPQRRRVADVGAIQEAGRAVGFPLVLKAVSAALPHKHQLGAVALAIGDVMGLEAAVARMQSALRQAGVHPDAFLVEEMVGDAVAEVLVGIQASAIYGQALVLGAGGVEAEHLRDTATLLLPASDAAILDALCALRVAGLLDAAARQAVVALAQAVAHYAAAHAGTLRALDINPVIVTRSGRVVAVDALVETRVPE